MPPQLVFRFDVDTHRCLTRGTPALRKLAAEAGVAFTFFVNMGRATSRRHVVTDVTRRRLHATPIAGEQTSRLSSLRKLGVASAARIVVMNPSVGRAKRDELVRLRDGGHELGLHGGRNHRVWQDRATVWPREQLVDEVAWGLQQLRHVVSEPVGFASPAWAHPADLAAISQAAGIAYLADMHGADVDGLYWETGMPSIATNLVGEPGGVGFLEWHRARGHDDHAILHDFRSRLDRIGDVAVLYDHPFWAGVDDLALTARLLREALDTGIEIVTLGRAVHDRLMTDPRV